MKRIILLMVFVVSCYCAYADGYKLHSSVFGAGASVSGGEYRLNGSASQPNIGFTENSGYSMRIGFWNTYLFKAHTSMYYPTTQASDIQFSNITRTGMTVRWAKGDGEGSLLLAKEQYRIATTPLTDGVVYENPNTNYTSAPSVGGAKLLYNGTAVNPSINVTGLTKYKLYYFRAFAYNNASNPYYLQTDGINNPASRWTLRRDGMMEEDLTIDAEYAYPNPASYSISTTLDMFEAGTVSAKLYDVAGRVAAELYNQSLPFGTHELKFDISNVPSGVYQLIISKGSEAIVYPVSVVK